QERRKGFSPGRLNEVGTQLRRSPVFVYVRRRGILGRRFMLRLFSAMLAFVLFFSMPLHADEEPKLSRGQSIYVPAYSHIFGGNKERPFLLAVTLSIRNIDPKNEIEITSVNYYATLGKHLRRFLDEPRRLQPLESLRYVIPEKDESGGSGTNFIVEWISAGLVNPPITECIMIGTQSQQGVSFSSRGRVILPSGD
ncbi:MAG: DUF3124 domain-containing protein, partial [Desulfococcaceae bacterium]